ncbi:MAG: cupin domain-containing protein [Candidatus Staskawiczbacteria bacterium]|nr:cupin domain-containing protein [Candidatus Staskawiczbacteria bacterium]
MEKEFLNVKDLISYSNGGILSKVIIKSEKLDVTLFSMAKGTEILEHTSTKSGFVYVVEGKGVFTLEGKDIQMFPGVFIQLGKNMVHSLKAEENTSFLLVLLV